ncbi:MAG: hypothetical protein VXY74_14260 [SAR324 cluster bacterium]|nr:hypothetical protein [SAR324 cluster bacterium]MEC8595952.1 hypothetical protein [SAR324 cluster bacterium]
MVTQNFATTKRTKNKACEEDLKSLGPEEAYLSESAFEKLGEGPITPYEIGL